MRLKQYLGENYSTTCLYKEEESGTSMNLDSTLSYYKWKSKWKSKKQRIEENKQ